MKKIRLSLLTIPVGAILVYLGGFILVEEKFKMFASLCIGLGAALFCIGIGRFTGGLIQSKTETGKIARVKNIEENDERNIRIREKVGAKINQVVLYALSVIVLAFGFMKINITAILMVASVFVLELVLAIALSSYYSKRM
ncbi:MAG: hypothetical protein GX424_05385 [Clostridiales bacterium]|jgi:uncharacterized membrane protein|nr:hypothetical protein [Clostridiales bacterium]